MIELHTEAEAVHAPENAVTSHAKTQCTSVMIFSQISESLSTKPLRHPKKGSKYVDDASDLRAIARAKKKGGYIALKDVLSKLGIE